MTKKKLSVIIVSLLILCVVVGACIFAIRSETTASQISKEDAQQLINTEFDSMATGKVLTYIADKNNITVNSIEHGDEKNIIADCVVETVDAYSVISPEYDRFMSTDVKKENGTMFKSALDFKLEFEGELLELVKQAEPITVKASINIYDTKDGFVIYASDKAVNTVYGGVIDVDADINEKTTVAVTDANGNVEEKNIESNNIKKGFVQCLTPKYNSDKPDTAGFIGKFWNNTKKDFVKNFIVHDRWKTVLSGLWVTIKLTFFALIIGIIIGFIVAFIRCTYIKNTKRGLILRVLNGISQVYLTVIRGTPVVVQIMIIYFLIFMPIGVDKFIAAVICFGFNSGAYVAEIVRGGIMSVDNGQTEAGRSLGFGYMQTMWYIVIPQAFKAVLPALANEFVVLLKETSIAFYIGIGDLMYSANSIRASTYSDFMPLVAVAIIYLIMVLALSKCVSLLERRLRNSER